MRKTPLRKKAKSHSEGWWRNKADDLMQDVHKTMYSNCLVCGGKNEVGHHFITKQSSSFLRYNFQNLVPLCRNCHFAHHIKSDPSVSAKIIKVLGANWYNWIEKVRRTVIKTGIVFYKKRCEEFDILLTKT